MFIESQSNKNKDFKFLSFKLPMMSPSVQINVTLRERICQKIGSERESDGSIRGPSQSDG